MAAYAVAEKELLFSYMASEGHIQQEKQKKEI